MMALAEGRGVEPLPVRTPTGSNRVANHLAVPSVIKEAHKQDFVSKRLFIFAATREYNGLELILLPYLPRIPHKVLESNNLDY